MEDLLLAINGVDEAAQVMPKVGQLIRGQEDNVRLTAARIVYEGLADLNTKQVDGLAELKRFVLEAEAPVLEEAVERFSRLPVQCLTLWHKHRWQGIVDAAASTGADMIVKAVAEPQTSVFVKTPDDWNLIRHSKVPVLLAHSAWTKHPRIFAALDVYDRSHAELNLRVLANARKLCQRLGAELHVVSVYPRISPLLDELASHWDHEKITTEIEREATDLVAGLCRQCDVEDYQLHLRQGEVDLQIESVAASAAVIVIGTKARSGVGAFVLGNTAEKILHSVKTDVLTVP